MKLLLPLLCILSMPYVSVADSEKLQKAIDGSHRTEAYTKRDQYRNPLKTLSLFDVQPHHTVVEIWPSGGWYTEILAPYLKEEGLLIAAHYDVDDDQAGYRALSRKKFEKKLSENKGVYGKVKTVSLMFDETKGALLKGAADANSVDRVVTFRSMHGMFSRGTVDAALAHYFEILKPGGKLGVVQHQADEDQDWASKNVGYVARSAIVERALKAGFVLEAEGYFNNNAKDDKRHEHGVWSLPPSLRGSKSDAEKAKYLEIGESNRMTLLFSKP